MKPRQVGCACAVWVYGLVLMSGAAQAVTVSWGPIFQIASANDILANGTVIAAVNAGALQNATVNTATGPVLFTGTNLPGFANSGNGGFYTPTTGDAGLDTILDSHSWSGGGANVTVGGLTVGQRYDIQFIVAADSRGCCAARNTVVDDLMGNISGNLQRGRADSVAGTFTASAATATFRIDNGSPNGVDPGISAFIVRTAIPEPMTFGLAGLGLLALARRPRRCV